MCVTERGTDRQRWANCDRVEKISFPGTTEHPLQRPPGGGDRLRAPGQQEEQCPRAAVMSDRGEGGSQRQKWVLAEARRPNVSRAGVRRAARLLEAPRANPRPCISRVAAVSLASVAASLSVSPSYGPLCVLVDALCLSLTRTLVRSGRPPRNLTVFDYVCGDFLHVR